MNIYKISDLLNDEIEETKRIRNQHLESDNKTGVLYWTARVSALEKFSARLDK